ncbi:tetratricopeptide repeat protein [Marinobacterium jannaschii]|uniref:tetratricopeptide repeat protein n=1 Tax=Marinobacterium jannaschii TaxID=64970 RepID=UPI000480FF49|nr:tetratricopeptide repeat protein [Marinobacterium jannaschii]
MTRTTKTLNAIGLALLLSYAPLSAAAAKPVLTAFEHKQLMAAKDALMAEKLTDAGKILRAMQEKPLKPYAKALVHQLLGNIDLSRERYSAALKQFKLAYAQNALPETEQLKLRHAIAQLYFSEEQWSEGISEMQQWMAEATQKAPTMIKANDHLLIAQGYSQLKQWSALISPIKKAISMRKKAPESWYQLQLGAHLRLKQHKSSSRLLKTMIVLFPGKMTYWEQLTDVYQRRKLDKQALATLRSAYIDGLFTKERHYMLLGQMLVRQGAPQRAAEVLSEALEKGQLKSGSKSLKLLSSAQLLAREYNDARPTLQKLLAIKNDTKTLRQLAQVEISLKRWDDAVRTIDRALARKPGNKGQLLVMRGIAQVNQHKLDDARRSFTQAKAEKATARSARNWLGYIDQIESNS